MWPGCQTRSHRSVAVLRMRNGTSQSPFRLALGDNHCAPVRPAPGHGFVTTGPQGGGRTSPWPYVEWLDGVSDALASGLCGFGTSPLRHAGQTPAPTPTGDYRPSLRSPWPAAIDNLTACKGQRSALGGLQVRLRSKVMGRKGGQSRLALGAQDLITRQAGKIRGRISSRGVQVSPCRADSTAANIPHASLHSRCPFRMPLHCMKARGRLSMAWFQP